MVSPDEVRSGPDAKYESGLAARRRLYKQFDFEESQRLPYEMPPGFYRYAGDADDMTGALAEGFPLFGEMRPVNDQAYTGRWSFGFDLEGGSMAARVPSAVIPVIPLNDYVVSVMIHTEGLVRSGTRLAAWFTDEHGAMIEASRQVSELVRSEVGWRQLSVTLRGDWLEAADLIIELQLLQPREAQVRETDPPEPLLEDITGRAWFDDVTIWHVPRITLRSGTGSNILTLDDPVSFEVAVRDVSEAALVASLTVVDVDRQTVFEESFPAPRGRRARKMTLPITRAGWYRVLLEVDDGDRVVGRRETDVAVLPGRAGQRLSGRSTRLGVALSHEVPPRLWPDLLAALGAGRAVVPVWPAQSESVLGDRELIDTIELLLSQRRDLILALEAVPRELTDAQSLDRSQVLELMGRPSAAWRPALQEVLDRFGLEVDQWQFGPSGDDTMPWQSDLEQKVRKATESLGTIVPSPRVYLPWPSDYEAPTRRGAWHLSIPAQVPVGSIEFLVDEWRQRTDDLLVNLGAVNTNYDARTRLVDLALRTLHAWRAGASTLVIPAPWQPAEDASEPPLPTVEFVLWGQLGAALEGRRFAGELDLAPGVHAWILEGVGGVKPAIIAWREESAPQPHIDATLGLVPVTRIDAFGNRQTIEPVRGTHSVPLDTLPVVIEGIDPYLSRFRRGVSLAPDRVDLLLRPAEHALVLTNPWPVSITGKATLRPPPGIQISPRTMDFVISAGEHVELPITLYFDRNLVSQEYGIDVTLDVTTDRTQQLTVSPKLQVGWNAVEVTAYWRRAVNAVTGQMDLVITQTITNTSDDVLSLMDCFVRAPGTRQMRKPIASINPGESVVRTFRIPNGVQTLSGETVRVGVAQRDGPHRQNLAIDVPAFLRDVASAVTDAGGS